MKTFSRGGFFAPASLFVAALVLAFCLALPLSADWRGVGRHAAAITVYTTLPAETVAPLAAEYGKSRRVNVDFVLLSGKEIVSRFAAKKNNPGKNSAAKNSSEKIKTSDDSNKAANNQAAANDKNFSARPAVILADADTLTEVAKVGGFVPFVSETSDNVAERFRGKNDAWVGVWYDPMIFVVNSDYFRSAKWVPLNWTELTRLPQTARLALTDFLAADAASRLFLSLVANFGEKETMAMLAAFHPHVVQYSKFLATPARMAGMGEVDVAIAARSEAFRYFEKSYPIRLVWPEDGTSYVLTGVGLTSGTDKDEAALAKEFADWLLSDEAQLALRSNDFYFVPVNPAALTGRAFSGRPGPLFDAPPVAGEKETRRLLDSWVKNIRVK